MAGYTSFAWVVLAVVDILPGPVGGAPARVLAALSAFGLVHVPAAVIIAIRRTRQHQGAEREGHQPEDWP